MILVDKISVGELSIMKDRMSEPLVKAVVDIVEIIAGKVYE